MSKPWIWVAAGVAILMAGGGWVLDQRSDRSLARVREAGRLRVGYAVEAPYAWVQDGQVTGEGPELARLVAARLGTPQLEWIQTSFDQLIPELLARRFDVVAAGLFITDARAERVRFSEPTLRVRPGILSRKAKPVHFDSYRVLLASSLRIGVLAGSVEETSMAQAHLAPEQLLRLPDVAAARSALITGAIDALLLSYPSARALVRADPDAFEAGIAEQEPASLVAFAFSQDDQRLVRAWNEAQAHIIGSPEHQALLREQGLDPSEMASKIGAP